jgi:hypothetical protein
MDPAKLTRYGLAAVLAYYLGQDALDRGTARTERTATVVALQAVAAKLDRIDATTTALASRGTAVAIRGQP